MDALRSTHSGAGPFILAALGLHIVGLAFVTRVPIAVRRRSDRR